MSAALNCRFEDFTDAFQCGDCVSTSSVSWTRENFCEGGRGAGRTHGLQAEVNLFYRGHRYRSKYSHEIIPRGVEVQDMGETDRWYGKVRRGVQNMRGKA